MTAKVAQAPFPGLHQPTAPLILKIPLGPEKEATFRIEEMIGMDFFQWHWWAALALAMMIAEIFLPGFFLFCLGVGCIAASIAAALSFGPAVQLLVFSVFALVAFFTVRPILMKRFWKKDHVRTNADALPGQHGRVSQDFDPGLRLGRVQVGGDDWRAECLTDSLLRIGDTIEVIRVESNTLIVKPLTNS